MAPAIASQMAADYVFADVLGGGTKRTQNRDIKRAKELAALLG